VNEVFPFKHEVTPSVEDSKEKYFLDSWSSDRLEEVIVAISVGRESVGEKHISGIFYPNGDVICSRAPIGIRHQQGILCRF